MCFSRSFEKREREKRDQSIAEGEAEGGEVFRMGTTIKAFQALEKEPIIEERLNSRGRG